MGSGKSTIGPLVAEEIGYDFVDLDDEVAARTGRSISELFEEQGEDGFREWEARLLDEISGRTRVVIALGGGALVQPDCFVRAFTAGEIVYLSVSVDELVARLKGMEGRPLLESARDLDSRIREMIERRRPIYEKAHHIVESSGLAPREAAELVVALWK